MKSLPLASVSATPRAPADALPILLITTPSIFLLDERVFVSLGILKVAAVLEQAGYRVEHLDLNGVENYEETVLAYAAVTKAKVFALTATTPQMPATSKIVRVIREVRHDVRIILGGPHITLVHSAMKLEKKAGRVGRGHGALEKLEGLFDVLVSGDGESAVFEALKEDAPKVVDADEPKNGMFMSNADYETSPLPARHLVDLESYRYEIEGRKATSTIAQLGCPLRCNFCGGRNTKMLRKIRTRSKESVVQEIESLYKTYGFTGFNFFDDELNINKNLVVEMMNAIADLQQRLGIEFRLRGFIKAELFTDEQAVAMHRAGFRWLLCGFEAADERILENIRKNATLEDNTRVMEIAARHDLKVKALMSVGHAGEREESIIAVHDWLLQVKPADFDTTVISTYAGTPYYDEALPNPALGPDVWTFRAANGDALHSRDVDYTEVADYYKGDPEGGYTAYVFTDYLSSDRIVELRNWVERDVREKLGIPFNPGSVAVRYEHSMGQGTIPLSILRTSAI
jgi:anaerobic magnesium-protoporphyrin IX monomethyl ester cyclase